MKTALVLIALLCSLARMRAAGQPIGDAGRKAEQRSCVQCHSTRLIDSQRLSSAAWNKEITKMIGWGAVVPDAAVLLEYLSQTYSDTSPVPAPQRSQPGKKSTN